MLQKKSVFPGEPFIFAIPPHLVQIICILQVNSGRFLVTSCLRACIYCALMMVIFTEGLTELPSECLLDSAHLEARATEIWQLSEILSSTEQSIQM